MKFFGRQEEFASDIDKIENGLKVAVEIQCQ